MPPWDTARPFSLAISSNYPFAPSAARQAISAGLWQFGGILGAGADGQDIHIDYDPDCNVNINPQFAAAVSPSNRSRIVVCPRYAQSLKDFGGDEAKTADVTIKHELGHVLGLDYHASTGLMKAVNDGSLRMFQTSDIAAICGAGHVISPACD